MKKLVFFLSLVLLGSVASADTLTQIEADWEKCNQDNSSTVGLKMCIEVAGEAADLELNRVYQDIVKSLKDFAANGEDDEKEYGKVNLASLIKSERAWIKFRDANLEAYANTYLGGTGAGVVSGSAWVRMTIDRARELQEMYSL
jgi:uncharacterized protein YecT (DUF1311 family)